MWTYIKAQAVAIAGSLADYAVTIFMVEVVHAPVVAANIAGNTTGGVLQFILSRNWAFRAEQGKVPAQLVRYIIMTIGNILISALLIYLLTHFLLWNYLVAKTAVSVLMGLTYNYFVQKKFVFAGSNKDQ